MNSPIVLVIIIIIILLLQICIILTTHAPAPEKTISIMRQTHLAFDKHL